jgi:flagellar FliJ protein
MKRFRFGLQKVLELREYTEEEAKIELGRAVSTLNLIEQRIAALAGERTQAAMERFSPGREFTEIQSYERYINRLDQTRDKLLMDAARAELEVEEKRDIYLEASRDRKVLDKIKERREGEYRKFVQGEENKELDEVAARVRHEAT